MSYHVWRQHTGPSMVPTPRPPTRKHYMDCSKQGPNSILVICIHESFSRMHKCIKCIWMLYVVWRIDCVQLWLVSIAPVPTTITILHALNITTTALLHCCTGVRCNQHSSAGRVHSAQCSSDTLAHYNALLWRHCGHMPHAFTSFIMNKAVL